VFLVLRVTFAMCLLVGELRSRELYFEVLA